MNLDLGEGEPDRAEHLGRRRWHRGGGTLWTHWTDWPLQAARATGAIGAVLAVLALLTGWTWLTLLAVGSLLAGVAILAIDTREPRRTDGSRASGLTLRAGRSWWALLPWFAHGSRLARGVRSRRPLSPWRPRRSSGAWSANDTSSLARRAGRTDDAVDDGPGEGQRR